MSNNDANDGKKITSIFTKQKDTPFTNGIEKLFEEIHNARTPSGHPLDEQQQEERSWFIDRKNDLFQEYQDRGFVNNGMLDYLIEIHNNEINDILSMDRKSWTAFTDAGMIDPLHMNKKAEQEVNSYIDKITKEHKSNDDDETNRFESKRELQEFIFKLQNMTIGEWNEAKQREYAFSQAFSGKESAFENNLDPETKAAITQNIQKSNNTRTQQHYDTALQLFKDRKILEASATLNLLPTGNIIGEEGKKSVIQEALDQGYIDEFTAERIKNGEVIHASAEKPNIPDDFRPN